MLLDTMITTGRSETRRQPWCGWRHHEQMAGAVALVFGIGSFLQARRSRNDLLSLLAQWLWLFVTTDAWALRISRFGIRSGHIL